MARFSIQLLILFFVVSFCVFFGVELAKQGIEEIHGPMENVAKEVSTSEIEPENQKSDDGISTIKEESPKLSFATTTEDSIGLSAKIGNALQSTAHKGVEIIVSVFHALFS
ncbi:hypothetical protein [Chengkuizengella marina]|uniref:DUF3679 domain-containing protein n=1 Tax=Chengkuizengella marina TaxID=2507566 RepID=A0A6N9Q3V7_9BACL|nr:hypothetical protein [Chengkuizengella marina]NBI29488.1 hypothetical protein [Chengkuizengella marina]